MGTARYLAPEQVNGKPADARTDVYALGLLLYEMLCGQPPFGGDTDVATAMARLTTSAPPIRRSVPTCPPRSTTSCTGAWRATRRAGSRRRRDVRARRGRVDPARRASPARSRCPAPRPKATGAHRAEAARRRPAKARPVRAREHDRGATLVLRSSVVVSRSTIAGAVDRSARWHRRRRPWPACVTTTTTSSRGHRAVTVARWRRCSTATPTACTRCAGA